MLGYEVARLGDPLSTHTSVCRLPDFPPLSPLHWCVYVEKTRFSSFMILITSMCVKQLPVFHSFISSSLACGKTARFSSWYLVLKCVYVARFSSFISRFTSMCVKRCPFFLLYLLFTSVCTLPVLPPLSPPYQCVYVACFSSFISSSPVMCTVTRFSSFIILITSVWTLSVFRATLSPLVTSSVIKLPVFPPLSSSLSTGCVYTCPFFLLYLLITSACLCYPFFLLYRISSPVCVRCPFFLLYLLITSMFKTLPVFPPLSPQSLSDV